MSERPPASASLDGSDGFRLLSAVEDCAVVLLDTDGYIRTWNTGAERIKGYRANEIIGQHISAFYPEEDIRSAKVAHELTEAARVGRFEDEGWRVRKDGTQFWANVIITALFDQAGSLTGYGKVTRDMTERRRFVQDLERARETAAAANRAKDEFLSSMSHELRTPLNAVLGFSQILEMDPLTETQQASVEHIIKAGRHLLDLINEILDISRIASGNLSLTREPVAVGQVVQDCVAMVSPLAATRGLRLRVEQVHDVYARADRQRLEQVVLNLLSNAIKYNRLGGEIVVSVRGGERVRLVVRDTGTGIDQAMMARLFSPFDRLGADTGEVEGTGLGLALSKGLVDAMGGTITATSTAGEGSVFTVELMAAGEDCGLSAHLADQPVPLAAALMPGRLQVLYIEDNQYNIVLLERIMGLRPRVELLVARSGKEGIEVARTQRPSLILLDMHLPDTSGEEVLRRLRSSEVTGDIPVVAVSADATAGRVNRMLLSGAADYITKPIVVADVLDALDRWCLAVL